MDFLVAFTTFIAIFPAELPDKSMIAAVVLSTRFRALPVWLGLAGAFLVHVAIAVTAGSLLSLLPDKAVATVVTVLFFVGAGVLLFGKGDDEEASELEKVQAPVMSSVRIAALAFGVVFASEWGDLTQIATMNLSARYSDPLSVGVGSLTALWLITGLGVLFGDRLTRILPVHVLRRIAGVVLLCLAVWSLIDLLRL